MTLSVPHLPSTNKELNPEQQAAMEYFLGPLLIIAGAGSGKTTVITEKIGYLINQGHAQPENILAITFTEKAAAEVEERVDKLLPYGYLDLSISTFHAFAQRLLEQHGLEIGLPHQFKLMDETQAWMLMRQNLKKINLDYYRPLGNPTKFIHAMLKHFSRCKDELITPEEYINYANTVRLDGDRAEFAAQETKRLEEIANAYYAYNQLLLDNGALDLGDLIYYVIRLFKERPKLLAHYQKRYTHILVDEFQDTNWAQYELIKMLVKGGGALTVVGDDDQSIFRFRGASVSNILQFKKDFPDAKEVVLTRNYRSPQNILDIAYTVIQNNNPDRLEAKLEGLDKHLKASTEMPGIITFIHAATLEDETSQVAQRIAALREETGCAWSDCAILVRANAHAEPFATKLRAMGIPVQFMAARGLYRQNIVLDALAFFKAIDSYHESAALYRLMNYPVFEMPFADVQEIMQLSKRKNWSLWFVLQHNTQWGLSEQGKKTANTIVHLIEYYAQRAKTVKPSQLLYYFFEETGYMALLARKEASGEKYWLEQIEFIRSFLDDVVMFEERASEQTVKRFLEYHQYVLEAGDEGLLASAEFGGDSVRVLTTHKAKGLEFKNVVVANLVEQRFPTSRRAEPIAIPDALVKELLPEGDPHIEEERRLFYVALTRAKKTLTLTAAHSYGGKRTHKLSRFIIEAGFKETTHEKEILQHTDAITRQHAPLDIRAERSAWRLPSVYSFSQFKTFTTCPLQYKYANLVKIPVAGKPYFSFGQAIHSTLELFYKRVQELNNAYQTDLFGLSQAAREPQTSGSVFVPTHNDLLAFYVESWHNDWYRDEEEKKNYFEKGKVILRDYYKKQSEAGWRVPLSLEQSFKVNIGAHLLSGRIDRIDACEDGIEIIDYKTGQPKDKLSSDDKEQLFIYQLAAQRVPALKTLGPARRLTFYYLENGITQSFIATPDELNAFEEKIETYVNELRASTFPATPSPVICPHCDYKDICSSRILK